MAVVFLVLTLFQFFMEPPRPQATGPLPAPAGGPPRVATPDLGPAAPAAAAPPEEPPALEEVLTLRGEQLEVGISTHGGRVVHSKLLKFADHRAFEPGRAPPHVDLSTASSESGGLMRLSFEGLSPTASYRVVARSPDSVTLERDAGGFLVRRTFKGDAQGYSLRSEVEITNRGEEARTLSPVVELTQAVRADEKDQGGFFSGGAPMDQTTSGPPPSNGSGWTSSTSWPPTFPGRAPRSNARPASRAPWPGSAWSTRP
jgi:YidC/Oxa1 family membrane protein insertase